MKNQDQLTHHRLSFKKLIKSIRKKKRRFTPMNRTSLNGSLKMSEIYIHETLSILHDTKALVSNSFWKISSLEEPSLLEDMEKIQRAMCNIEGNFMSFLFDRNNLVDINECLHE